MRTAPAESPPDAYDRRTIYLHWISAMLVALLWGVAQIIDLFPKGPPKIAVRSVHMVLGLLLAIVLVRRLAWRAAAGRSLAPARGGSWGYVVGVSHAMLYALLAAVVVLGVSNVWVRGDSIFGLFSVPRLLPEYQWLKPAVGKLHKLGANALVMVALAHALAALFHHYILRDTVLKRMLVRRPDP